jgi:hypothetical protein
VAQVVETADACARKMTWQTNPGTRPNKYIFESYMYPAHVCVFRNVRVHKSRRQLSRNGCRAQPCDSARQAYPNTAAPTFFH